MNRQQAFDTFRDTYRYVGSQFHNVLTYTNVPRDVANQIIERLKLPLAIADMNGGFKVEYKGGVVCS